MVMLAPQSFVPALAFGRQMIAMLELRCELGVSAETYCPSYPGLLIQNVSAKVMGNLLKSQASVA